MEKGEVRFGCVRRPIDNADAALRRRLDQRLTAVGRSKPLRSAFHGNGRKDRRSAAYRAASATLEPGLQAGCRVIDLSASGLKLEFHENGRLPDEFAVKIPTLRFIGIVRKAWQQDRHVGVSIVRWQDLAAAG